MNTPLSYTWKWRTITLKQVNNMRHIWLFKYFPTCRILYSKIVKPRRKFMPLHYNSQERKWKNHNYLNTCSCEKTIKVNQFSNVKLQILMGVYFRVDAGTKWLRTFMVLSITDLYSECILRNELYTAWSLTRTHYYLWAKREEICRAYM